LGFVFCFELVGAGLAPPSLRLATAFKFRVSF
jgi:hypothetical protein